MEINFFLVNVQSDVCMTVSRIRGHFGEVAILVCCILSEFFFFLVCMQLIVLLNLEGFLRFLFVLMLQCFQLSLIYIRNTFKQVLVLQVSPLSCCCCQRSYGYIYIYIYIYIPFVAIRKAILLKVISITFLDWTENLLFPYSGEFQSGISIFGIRNLRLFQRQNLVATSSYFWLSNICTLVSVI